MSQSEALDLHLHAKQGEALNTAATEVLYGGAAGGGKSHLMRVAAIIWCSIIPGLQVYIFRRIREDLIKNHMEGPKGFRALLSLWVTLGFVRIVEDEIRFWNGSKIFLCHCKDAKDVYKYQGAEIHVLLIDELTHFTEAMYRYLRSRVRMVGIAVPAEMAGRFPRILCGSNPGNIGHLWVKTFWIDGALPFDLRLMPQDEGGMVRQYIPARLDDNPSMVTDDPGYEGKLAGLGSASLVKAMRFGDWSVIEGAFFDCWSAEKHVVPPFEIPDHWARARSFDWGFAKPFSVGWWAVASEPRKLSNGLTLPRGGIVRYREWYGAAGPDTGIRLQAEQIAEGIRSREKGETMAISVGDPAIWAEAGASHGVPGPSIGEKMAKAGVPFSPADNRRKQGWDQFRGRLLGDAEGNPMMVVFSTCGDFIRTVPVLQHDKLKPEDVDTEAEDHCFTGETSVLTPAGARRIDSLIGEDGVVLSADGAWHAYRSARLIKRDARILAVRFDDGSVVRCTPDHRFMTEVGWTEAQHLAGMAILSWSAPRSRNLPASGSISADATSSARGGGCTSPFGRAHTALCRRAIMSIIGLAATATGCPILNASPRGSILASAMVPTLANAAGEQFGRRQSALGSGTAVRLGASGTVSNMSFIARRLSRLVSNAAAIIATANSALRARASTARPIAEQQPGENPVSTTSIGPAPHVAVHSSPIGTRGRGRAAPSAGGQYVAGWLRCLSVTPAGREDVYCLTVPDTGNFVLANGAVVANCADEARYFCMSRPWARPTPQPAGPVIDTRIPAIADLVKAAERRRVTNRRI